MATTIVTVTREGLLALPPDFVAEHKLHPGAQVVVTLGDKLREVLAPADDLDALCGLFSSTPGLAEELQQERRNDT